MSRPPWMGVKLVESKSAAGLAVTGWKWREGSAAPVAEIRDAGTETWCARRREPGEPL